MFSGNFLGWGCLAVHSIDEVSAIEKLASGLLVIRTEFGDRSQWRDDPGIRGGHRLLQSQWHPVMMTVSFWTSVPISSSCVIPSQVD
jgi:hypothetical protein